MTPTERAQPNDLTTECLEHLRTLVHSRVREVPDFPKPGILFRDITPVLHDPIAFQAAVTLHLHHVADVADTIDLVVGIESRGFLFGAVLAERTGVGFVPVRKPGKLPAATTRVEYALEYGTDCVEIHTDAIGPGQRVLVVDDLLATGGTAAATCGLLERLDARIECTLFLIELVDLDGRAKLAGRRIESILRCEG